MEKHVLALRAIRDLMIQLAGFAVAGQRVVISPADGAHWEQLAAHLGEAADYLAAQSAASKAAADRPAPAAPAAPAPPRVESIGEFCEEVRRRVGVEHLEKRTARALGDVWRAIDEVKVQVAALERQANPTDRG